MTTLTKDHLVTCKIFAHRFVVHEHELSPGAAVLLEESLKRRLGWLKSVWVDHDAPRQFTVRFDPDETFKNTAEIEEPELSDEIIEHTLQFISWSSDKTHVEFEDF